MIRKASSSVKVGYTKAERVDIDEAMVNLTIVANNRLAEINILKAQLDDMKSALKTNNESMHLMASTHLTELRNEEVIEIESVEAIVQLLNGFTPYFRIYSHVKCMEHLSVIKKLADKPVRLANTKDHMEKIFDKESLHR